MEAFDKVLVVITIITTTIDIDHTAMTLQGCVKEGLGENPSEQPTNGTPPLHKLISCCCIKKIM